MPRLSVATIRRHLRAGDAAATPVARGDALEDLLEYVFGVVPGVRLQKRDVLVAAGSEELDLVFWNDRLRTGLHFLDENVLFFECKNWGVPVGSQTLAGFAMKAVARHLRYAFLVAANGVTGDPHDRTAAMAQIDTIFVQHHCHIIVLDRADLEALTNTSQLVGLIKLRISEIVLRASR